MTQLVIVFNQCLLHLCFFLNSLLLESFVLLFKFIIRVVRDESIQCISRGHGCGWNLREKKFSEVFLSL